MNIEIEYCQMWNYLPQASSLAAELKDKLSVDAKLIPGRNGVFEVMVDGKLLFSKKSLRRFPEPGEVAELIQRQ